MAQITGGELNYSVTVDIDQLKKGMSDGEGRIMGFSEVAEKAGTTLQNSFDKSGTKVKDFTGIVRENISIQKQVIKELESQIKEVQDRASNIAPGIGQATILNEAKSLEKELAGEKAALADLEIAMSKTAVTSTTLGTKLAEAKNRLAELNLAAKEGKEVTAEQFRDAEAEVKKYGEAISDTNARTKALTAGTIGSLAQGLSLVTGTMAMGTSLMGAFGGKSEELNQIMLKTQALLAATVTLQEIKNTTVQKGGVISGVMAVQEYARARGADAATLASGRATLAQKAWNVVANANPYVLLATAILTVVGAIGLYIAATNQAEVKTKSLIDLNKKIADSIAEPLVAYRALQTQWNALGNDLKAKEKFIKDNKDEFNKLGVEVKNVSDAENVLVANTGAFVQSMMLKAKATAMQQKAVEDTRKSLELEADYRRKYIDKDLTVGEKILMPTQAAARSYAKSDAEEIRKINQGIYDDSLKQLEVQNKLADIAKRSGFKTPTKGGETKINSGKPDKPKPITPEEILPLGSVAEIRRRLSSIDEALSKSTSTAQIEKLKTQRLSVAVELAEALKKIEIKSLEDRSTEQEKYAKAYAIIAEMQGKEAADKLYGPLMEGAQSYYEWLTNEQDKLLQKGGLLSDVDKENLIFLTQKINEIQGQKNAFQNFANGIEDALAKIPTLSGQLEFLQNKAEERLSEKGNKSFDDGEQKFLKEKQDAILKQQQDNFQQMLDEQQSYEEKSLKLAQEYAAVKKSEQYKNASASDQQKIDKSFSDKQGVLDIDMIQKSAEWQVAFSELEGMTNTSLQLILQRLLDFQAKSKGTLSLQDSAELQKAIDNVQNAANRNPFQKLTANFSGYRTTLLASRKAQEEYNRVLRETPNDAKKVAEAGAKMVEADKKALEAKKKLLGQLQEGQNIFNAVGQGVMELGDAFGGFDDATNDAIGNIMDIGNAAFDLGKSIATGDVAGMISAGIKLIGSIGKALNGDQKKERDIKKQAAALRELEAVYNDLGRAIEKALGDKFFDTSTAAINNMKQQKVLLEQMIRTEQSKKKTDNDKVNTYKDQIKSINIAIEDMQQSMIDKVLNGINAKGLADKFTYVLTTAFATGEDAAQAMGKTVDDVMRDMVKNALKMKILEPAMKGIIDKMMASMGYNADGSGTFDGLTEAELAELKSLSAAAGENFTKAWASVAGMFNDSAAGAQGMKADIKGVTEKTAGALEGQINAMRMNQAENLLMMRNSLLHLAQIEQNTRPIAGIHQGILGVQRGIDDLNSKFSKNTLKSMGL